LAYITAFSVDGLAGHEGTYSKDLQRDVNVFFGVNGSGKTTLLKILHSALSADVAILKGLPFRGAKVSVYLNRHRAVFTRSYEQPMPSTESEESAKREELVGLEVHPRSLEQRQWSSDPQEPSEYLTHYREGYLPITRLYRSVGSRTSGVRAMSEEELDARFAEGVQRLWADYYADISNEISQAQERGLANILHFVLTGEEPETEDDRILETPEAYKRVSEFLSRQAGFARVLGSQKDFERKYKSGRQIKSIVKQIDLIEKRIEQATAPRQRLKELLESMYGGNKRIVFSEKEIGVELGSQGKLRLPSLSSGEKQMFFISLAALRAGDHSLIIDEPELSMHVDWQKNLVRSLAELNPRMQLIMATHSPEVMADLADSKIFAL
jgi:predicted ATP-dependent endonuclease of OLD family